MKKLIPFALLALTVAACNNRSAVSTSGIGGADALMVNPIATPKGTETGVKCLLATQTERREIFVQGLQEGSKTITLHDLSGLDVENHELYLDTLTLFDRKLPGFEIDGKIKKKDKYTEADAKETVRIQITEEYQDPTNPDNIRPGMVIVGIKYKLRLPNNQETVGDISRAYQYARPRNLQDRFDKNTGDWKVIADIDDCHAVNAQPKSPAKKPSRR